MSTLDVLKLLQNRTKAEVFLVGGFVRDYLLGKDNNDLDIVIRNMSEQGIIKFLRKHGKVKKVNLSKVPNFFDVHVILFKARDGKREAQITLPRRGKMQIAESHNTLRQDSKHRDFTANALYLPISYEGPEEVVDLVGGKKDIERRLIVANGSPKERIEESPIRMLRAISLAARTGFSIEMSLLAEISANINLLENVPVEAIRKEFNTILLSEKPSKYLTILQSLGALKIFAPELDACYKVGQDSKYHDYDVFVHSIMSCDNANPDIVSRLAALFHDVGKPPTRKEEGNRITFHKHEIESHKLTRKFLARLKYDTSLKRQVLNLVRLHMYHFTREWTDSAIRRFIKKAGITEKDLENLDEFPLFKLRQAERLGSGAKDEPITDRQRDFQKRIIEVYKETNAFDIKDLDIDGHTIMSIFKVEEGRQVGDVLKYLHKLVLEDQSLNDKKKLLALTAEYLHKRLA